MTDDMVKLYFRVRDASMKAFTNECEEQEDSFGQGYWRGAMHAYEATLHDLYLFLDFKTQEAIDKSEKSDPAGGP